MRRVEVAHVYARRVVARAREAIGQVVDWAVVPPHEETVGRITVLANPCGDLNRSRILQRALPDESAHEPVACPEERGEEREERESAARPGAEVIPSLEERKRRWGGEHGEHRQELQEVVLVEPAA